MSIAKLYTDSVKENFKVLYANWEPGGPISLGNYGIMQGNIFIPVGSLEEDFPEFENGFIKKATDPTKDTKEFKSESGVEVRQSAKGTLNPQGVPLAKAVLDIQLTRKDTIFFNASGCTTNRISNKAILGEKLKELLNAKRWKKAYCVVTDLVTVDRTIVVISEGDKSGVQFEADSPALEKINLSDSSIKLDLTYENNVGYKIAADEGLNLLIGLCKIKNAFLWWGDKFTPRTLRMTSEMEYAIENSPDIETEESMEDLVFAQMGKE